LVVVEAVDDDGDCASLQGLGVEGRKYDDIGRNDERYTSSSGSNQPINQSIRTACQWVEQFLIDTHSHTHTDAGLSTEYAAIGTRSCALQHATIQSGVTTAMSRISACLRCSMVEVLAADRWVQMMCVVFSNDR
jgi:hypothetical protein